MRGDGSFSRLIGYLNEAVENFVDIRTGNNSRYPIRDVVLSAFSVFFTQSPSFLSFQTMMEKNKGNNNARTLFGLEEIPSDNQIRNLLDPTRAEILFPVFLKILEYVEERDELKAYRVFDNTILVALDGTGYFYSEKLSCPAIKTGGSATRIAPSPRLSCDRIVPALFLFRPSSSIRRTEAIKKTARIGRRSGGWSAGAAGSRT